MFIDNANSPLFIRNGRLMKVGYTGSEQAFDGFFATEVVSDIATRYPFATIVTSDGHFLMVVEREDFNAQIWYEYWIRAVRELHNLINSKGFRYAYDNAYTMRPRGERLESDYAIHCAHRFVLRTHPDSFLRKEAFPVTDP